MSFMEKFGGTTPTQTAQNFIEQFNGFTEPYFFYNGEVELRYQPDEHVYYKMVDGVFVPQDGVTNVCHIIDKSNALIPWAAKMVIEKLLRSVPTYTIPTGEVMLTQMTLADFEKIALEAKSAPRDKVEEAADIGHIAHDWIEQYIKSVLSGDESRKLEILAKFPDDERARNCCIAALHWMERHNVRWLETERKIYSRKHGYAGTMDGLCLVDNCDDPLCCPQPFKDRLTVADWKSSNYLYIEYLYQTAAYEAAYEEEFGVDVQDRWVIRLGKADGEFDPWHLGHENFEEDFSGFLTALAMTRSVHSVEERMKIKKDFIKEEKKKAKAAAKEAEKKAKEEAKEKAKADKAAALAIKCKSADKFKGTKYPTCNDGNPCQTCLEIYNKRQAEKIQIRVIPAEEAII